MTLVEFAANEKLAIKVQILIPNMQNIIDIYFRTDQ